MEKIAIHILGCMEKVNKINSSQNHLFLVNYMHHISTYFLLIKKNWLFYALFIVVIKEKQQQ